MSSIRNQCRFCSDPAAKLFIRQYTKLILDVASFEINLSPGLPDKICIGCYKKLKDAHQFRTKCRAEEEKWLKLLKLPFKSVPDGNSLTNEFLSTVIVKEEYIDPVQDPGSDNDPSDFEDDDFDVVQIENLSARVQIEKDIKPVQQKRGKIQSTNTIKPDLEIKMEVDSVKLEPEINYDNYDSDVKPPSLEPKTAPSNSDVTSKRRRGRPSTKSLKSEVQIKRGRGRPRKNPDLIGKITKVQDIQFELNKTDHDRSVMKICCQCKYITYSISDLHRHYDAAHATVINGVKSDDPAQCPLCFKTFSSEEELKSTHFRSYPDMKCEICGLQFEPKELIQLRKHLETHPEHYFECTECGKRHDRYDPFYLHLMRHRNANKFLCPICGKRFSKKSGLKDHSYSHMKQKMFKCDICGSEVARRHTLINHMMIHTGQKKYFCEFCSKGFYDYTDWKRHLSSHTGIYPHNCKICNRGFHRLKHYNEHMERLH